MHGGLPSKQKPFWSQTKPITPSYPLHDQYHTIYYLIRISI
ncbi:hypothetical protein VPHK437A_0012 [Vibrio phage K437a]